MNVSTEQQAGIRSSEARPNTDTANGSRFAIEGKVDSWNEFNLPVFGQAWRNENIGLQTRPSLG